MYPLMKRMIDLLVSLILVIMISPVWLLCALAVKLTSPGPLLFTQTRGGRRGQPFEALKFRTMRADHVHDPNEIVPLGHSAITPIGRILRRTKLDETPQLVNVLCGHMSLIGPRPTIMEQVEAYDEFQRRRLEVRPGITGLAQINGNAAISWDERIKYDVYYVDHMSAAMDLMILVKTVIVILRGEERYVQPFDESSYSRKAQ
jgi:lipopolysaccharide/colanic/teichoic acid biosynthesis glycosyltransferase